MKKRYKFISCGILLILFYASHAAGESEFERVAGNFLKHIGCTKDILSTRMIEENTLSPGGPPIKIACLVTLNGGGYILLSTSHELTPVKAYSTEKNFDTLPEPYKHYILLEMEYNVRVRNISVRVPTEIGETEKRWNFLLEYDNFRSPMAYTPGQYLITTKWNQGHPYNRYLPEIGGQKVPAGCVNIAMAQIMKYYGYPSAGNGVTSYYWNGQDLKTILNRPFNWANMPNELTGTEPDYQIDEVALLIRDLTVINKTEFGLMGSSTSTNIQGLIYHFGYAPTILSMDNSDEELFFQTLGTEIDAERPVLLSFPGHMTIADGYADDVTGRKIHINMGWGGHNDDFYYLDKAAGEIIVDDEQGISFTPDLQIIYGLRPCSGNDCPGNLEENDTVQGMNIAGRFDFQYDLDEYFLYLKGASTLSGNRQGYLDQGFYITVCNDQNAVLASGDRTLNMPDLPPGRYHLRASLVNGPGGQYLLSDHPAYTITITTQPLSESEIMAADAAQDIAPVIFNDFQPLLLNLSSSDPLHLLIDARDENGDALTLRALHSNPAALELSLTGNILTISPEQGSGGKSSAIRVIATANGKSTDKTFIAMCLNGEVDFGQTCEAKGIFENQNDFNIHRVILDGNCTISGYRGFSTQAFYTSVLSKDGNTIVPPGDVEISRNFTQGIYQIGTSLCQNPGGYGSFYPYTEGENDQYVLTIQCPEADESPAVIASLLNIDLSGAELPFLVPVDIDGDGIADLADALLVCRVLSGLDLSGVQPDYDPLNGDINGDGKIGMEEAVYILQYLSGIR